MDINAFYSGDTQKHIICTGYLFKPKYSLNSPFQSASMGVYEPDVQLPYQIFR